MPRTPDASEGPRLEEAVIWDEQTSDPSEDLRLQYVQNKGLAVYSDGVSRPIGEERDATWQSVVDETGVDDPPSAPSAGDRVIVGSSPTGAFVGHAGEVAQYTGSAWVFSTPKEGTTVYLKTQGGVFHQTASSTPWVWARDVPGGEPVGFPNRTDSTLSFVDGTRTFSISPASSEFSFYVEGGVKYTKTTQQDVVISDTEGIHYIYFDTDGVLQSTTTFVDDLILRYAFVGVLYWDATNDTAIYKGDERHGLVMDGVTHYHWHSTLGTAFYAGLSLNSILADENGSLDTHAQIGTDSGTIADEDIIISISADTAPAQIPVFYRDGASGDWRRRTKDNFPVYPFSGGSGRLAWNEWTGSTWQQTEVGNADFVLAHLFATNDPDQPWIAVQGQSDYGNIASARAGAQTELGSLVTVGLPFVEFVAIATLIYQTSTGYTNTVKARIRTAEDGNDWVDWRYSAISPSAPPQDVVPHKLTHEQSGSDELWVQNLGTGSEVVGQTLQTDGVGGIQLAAVVSGYPPAFDTVESAALETTTLSAWQQKLTLTTPSLEEGSYILFAQAIMLGSKSNSQYEVRAQYDNTDDFGLLNAQAGVAFSEYQFFTHTIKETISGVHTIDIDYRKVAGSGYVGIKSARITYWRISAS